MLPLLAGCTRHSKSEQYYLIATNTAVPYWKSAADGFAAAGAEYGVSVDTRGPAGLNPQAEVDEFKAMVARKPAGILVSVANSKLMAPEIDAAIAAGIPVITMDSDSPESKRLYFIGTNNLEAGRLGGRRVAARLNGKGNVVFFTNPGQPNLDERLKGYQDIFAGYPGIKVVEVFDIKADPGTALDQAGVYLARTGPAKIDAFICLDSQVGFERGGGVQAEECHRPVADCDGCGHRYAAAGGGWNDRFDDLSKAVHDGFSGVEGTGRHPSLPGEAAGRRLWAGSELSVPGFYRYGGCAGG